MSNVKVLMDTASTGHATMRTDVDNTAGDDTEAVPTLRGRFCFPFVRNSPDTLEHVRKRPHVVSGVTLAQTLEVNRASR